MSIQHADNRDLTAVERIVIETIREIYPRYYPTGAVEFFLKHHNSERIDADIKAGCVYIFYEASTPVGTVTVNGNEINRLFVLPNQQGRGFGGALMDFAENLVFKSFDIAVLHASLPGKQMYLHRGYKETEYRTVMTENGDYLCADIMEKQLK